MLLFLICNFFLFITIFYTFTLKLKFYFITIIIFVCKLFYRELPIEHQRRIIGYHDLDAPANFDIFD